MSEPEKIKEKPPAPPPQEQVKEPPKTGQSAFDKILEQQKILQQSPLAQGKISEQGSSEQKVREITKWQESSDEKNKKEERREEGNKEKSKLKQKSGTDTVTREAVVRGGDKKGFSGGGGGFSGGKEGGGYRGADLAKKQIVDKKLSDAGHLLSMLGKDSFASKLMAKGTTLRPQQMQAIVNQIVQAIKLGKSELGWPELMLVLRDNIFSGLRLRFTSIHGKVSIQFETADRKVKDLFTAEAGRIKSALEEKGIAVKEIKIT